MTRLPNGQILAAGGDMGYALGSNSAELFDPASASAPFIATFVDVTGLIIYFNVALHILLR